MINRDRFKDAPWYDSKTVTSCIVGGAGGIGSWLTLLLSRAGFNPIVYDFDTVESHNIGGQLYSQQDIGSYKVDALSRIVKDFSDIELEVFTEKVTEDTMTHQFVFSAFDNMEARKNMFEKWTEQNQDNPKAVFIDGRLLMEQLQIFCVTPENIERYRTEALFDDSEVEDEACTLKQTSHAAAMIASLMVGFFTNHIANNRNGKTRDVPLFHEYYIPINLTN